MKMLWPGIRSIVNVKTKSQLSQISHLLENDKQVDDPVKVANMFNNCFVNVGGDIDKSVPKTRKSPMDYLLNRIPSSIFLAPVTEGETEITIESFNEKKAIGKINPLHKKDSCDNPSNYKPISVLSVFF